MPSACAEAMSGGAPLRDLASLFRTMASTWEELCWIEHPGLSLGAIGHPEFEARHLLVTGAAFIHDEAEGAIDAFASAVGDAAWIGWIGYEAGVALLELPALPSSTPQLAALRIDEWLAVDEHGRVIGTPAALAAAQHDAHPVAAPRAIARHEGGDRERVGLAHAALDHAVLDHAALDHAPLDDEAGEPILAGSNAVQLDSDRRYLARIGQCRAAIERGDSYLLCLTTAYSSAPIDAVESHLALREVAKAPRAGFLRIAGVALSSASPETFLELHRGRASTSPIKGTAPRADGAEDVRLAQALHSDAKERAENTMIVDLMRNDLQRVAEPGGVEVTAMLRVESHATVHQLVSTVEAAVLEGVGTFDVLRATFPAGSMTGAPKRRSVELLQQIEGRPRGIYSGCFGLFAKQDASLAMTIRAVVSTESGASIGVGGGVTALSSAAAELAETKLKAAAMVTALRAR